MRASQNDEEAGSVGHYDRLEGPPTAVFSRSDKGLRAETGGTEPA